jgi:hypothetical protein
MPEFRKRWPRFSARHRNSSYRTFSSAVARHFRCKTLRRCPMMVTDVPVRAVTRARKRAQLRFPGVTARSARGHRVRDAPSAGAEGAGFRLSGVSLLDSGLFGQSGCVNGILGCEKLVVERILCAVLFATNAVARVDG